VSGRSVLSSGLKGVNAIKSRFLFIVTIVILVLVSLLSGCNKQPVTVNTQPHSTSSVQTQTQVMTQTPSTSISTPTSQSSGSSTRSSDVTLEPSGSPADVISRANNFLTGIRSYYFDRQVSSTKSAKADHSDQKTITVIGKKSSIDLVNHSLQIYNKIFVKLASGQMAGNIFENSIFIDNKTVYLQGVFPTDPLLWSKTPLTEEYWRQQNQAQLIKDLLNPQNTSLLAPEILKTNSFEVPCDVVQVSYDLEKLWIFLRMQPGVDLPPSAPAGVSYNQIINKSEIKIWISRLNGSLVQSTINVNTRVDPAIVPSLSSSVTNDFSLSFDFYDYNLPFKIIVSPEALAAQELNLQKP
jgi:hypothetical protein